MPIPFPYGRSRIPVIAPLWMDFDFRNTVPGSAVFYNTYQDEGIPSLGNAILDEFKRRLNDSNFEIKWVAVFTWNEATPYPYYLWQHHFMGVSYYLHIFISCLSLCFSTESNISTCPCH